MLILVIITVLWYFSVEVFKIGTQVEKTFEQYVFQDIESAVFTEVDVEVSLSTRCYHRIIFR